MAMHQRVRPKKSLSQNFLVDESVARKIAMSLDVREGACVVEIGPGTGALTKHLVQTTSRLICIEKDQRSVEYLNTHFRVHLTAEAREASGCAMEVREGDILQTDFAAMRNECREGLSVIGNIPYAITSEILFLLFDNARYLDTCVLMMQREVARRLVAKTRSKDYGILTLAAEMAADVRLLFDVKPGSFYPMPAVTSSVVHMRFRNHPTVHASLHDMRALIRSAFSQRRKTLRNALESYVRTSYNADVRRFDIAALDQRAEELNITQFEQLLNDIREQGA